MKLPALKRKIKLRMQYRAKDKRTNLSLSVISASILVVVLLAFCVIQLLVVSTLSPRGKDLKWLDYEKEILVEENRVLEQELAEYSSLTMIKARAEGQLDMDRAKKVIYLSAPSASAEIINTRENE